MQRLNNKQLVSMQINLSELPYLRCPAAVVEDVEGCEGAGVCGCEEFERVEKMRVMSPIMSPSGNVHYFVEWRYKCVECGALLPLSKDYPGCIPVMAQLAKR